MEKLKFLQKLHLKQYYSSFVTLVCLLCMYFSERNTTVSYVAALMLTVVIGFTVFDLTMDTINNVIHLTRLIPFILILIYFGHDNDIYCSLSNYDLNKTILIVFINVVLILTLIVIFKLRRVQDTAGDKAFMVGFFAVCAAIYLVMALLVSFPMLSLKEPKTAEFKIIEVVEIGREPIDKGLPPLFVPTVDNTYKVEYLGEDEYFSSMENLALKSDWDLKPGDIAKVKFYENPMGIDYKTIEKTTP